MERIHPRRLTRWPQMAALLTATLHSGPNLNIGLERPFTRLALLLDKQTLGTVTTGEGKVYFSSGQSRVTVSACARQSAARAPNTLCNLPAESVQTEPRALREK